MAKVFKSNLPKVISVANKEISTLIESDIASESKVLKGLVDQVLKANIEVKKKNNLRITETKRRINELDTEISKLNISISDVDRDTVIKQLNEMIDAENTIFNSRQDIRFYDVQQSNNKLTGFQAANEALSSKIKEMYDFEMIYQKKLHNTNNTLFDKQFEITSKITSMMKDIFEERGTVIQGKLQEFRVIEDHISALEIKLLADLNTQVTEYYNTHNDTAAAFVADLSKEELDEEIKSNYLETVKKLKSEIDTTEKTHTELIKELTKELETERKRVSDEIYTEEDAPVVVPDSKEDQLKSIRLQIMDAEKKNDLGLVAKLLKQFDRIENKEAKIPKDKKSIEFHKVYSKIEKRIKTNISLATSEKIKLVNNLDYRLEEEKINFDESKMLYKIKRDRDDLSLLLDASSEQIETLQLTLKNKLNTVKEVYSYKRDLRTSELEVMRSNELMELTMVEEYRTLLAGIKEIEHERQTTFTEDINSYDAIKVAQDNLVKKDIERIKLETEIAKIDKTIEAQRKEAQIQTEIIKEDATSEIIYQESLLEIAKKEHELQKIKVQSLYQNEKTLAEDQINRISLGIQVNDAFVKTTLNNQLSFANQQIKLAESECEIRVESINLTRQQELNYSTKKIDLFMHKYEYEKNKLAKECDAQLEDLKYKLLLFRDEKENKEIQNKIEDIKEQYKVKIDHITDEEKSDPEIMRYKKVLDEANNRAEEAIKEAEMVKNQTINQFEKLRQDTMEKFDSMVLSESGKDNDMNPVAHNQVITSSEGRMQKAINEADELYEDKIKEPKEIIETNKEVLANVDSNIALDEFIEALTAKKQTFVASYQENIQYIEEETIKSNKPLEDLLVKARAIKQMEHKYLHEKIADDITYRDEEAIHDDYDALLNKELQVHKENELKVETSVSKQLDSFKTLQSSLLSDLNAAIKKFDNYIDLASSDLRKQKKLLQKTFKDELKMKLSVLK